MRASPSSTRRRRAPSSVFDASRLVRAVISDELALSNGERILMSGASSSAIRRDARRAHRP